MSVKPANQSASVPSAAQTDRSFTDRVTVHGGKNWDDYTELHKRMEAKGFKRTVRIGGAEYHLPDGEYVITMSAATTSAAVAESASQIAAQVKKDPVVFVTRSAGRAVKGLEPVKANKLSSPLLVLAEQAAKKKPPR